MKIAIGSDHAGWQVKEKIKAYLKTLRKSRRSSGHRFLAKVRDFGAYSEESVDYPDYAYKVARAVAQKKFTFGILVCGSGMGMCIAANRIKGVRAANCYDKTTAELSRRHNNANLLCLGARLIPMNKIKAIIKVWIATPFERGRHERRVKKLK
ncbi:MAG: ribose 5-phosphate isomerase B [Planctomycetes bacterium]|nr:ribose 5-phosphate isomerase B [Planctomycetota bacterium]